MKLISTMMASLGPIRLLQLTGFEQRTNDVVYCPPLKKAQNTDLIVFFGGDVQVIYFKNCNSGLSIESCSSKHLKILIISKIY